MKKDINIAEYIICGQPNVVDYFYSEFDDEYIEQIFTEFNSLSIIYRKPEEKFAKYIPEDLNEENEDEDKDNDEDLNEDKPIPKQENNINESNNYSNNNMDNNNNMNNNMPPMNNNMRPMNNNNMQIVKIPPISEDNLKQDFTIDESTYQNLWGQYQSNVHPTFKMIADEVEVPEYVKYLESKFIFTKAYGTNNGVSTLFLFSCEQSNNIIFIAKLVLDSTKQQIEYELKSSNEEYAKNYNNYLYENVSPLIDQ